MITFAWAVLFLMSTPGPGVLTVAGIGAGFGMRAAARYILGLFIGTNLVALAVVTGLAALILADDRLRIVLFTLSFSYLAYLALRIALAGSKIAFIENARAPGIRDGVLLQLINPKAYAVNTALFIGFALFPDAYIQEVIVKFVIANAIWTPIHFIWAWAGVSLHKLNISASATRAINLAMAAALLIVVGLAIWSL
ncbi:MAG: LysE family transporter [Marinovum sp.]|nr:LysE family transporter [Marinovum sp.]